MSALRELLIDELKDIYHAEKQLLKALPKMAKAAQSEELRQALEDHLSETEEQASRIEEVFGALGEKVQAKPCKAMQGLIEEAQEILSEHKGSPALDAAIISAAQKVEHYEIASYGCLCTWAELLEESEALDLLKQTMGEEEAADEKLTEVAQSVANVEAQAGEGGEDSEEESSDQRRSSRRGSVVKRR